MRYSVPLITVLAATTSATAPQEAKRDGAKLFTLEIAPGETVEVTEDEKFQMIDVSDCAA
jgi:leucyl aminopeptidase